MNNVLDLLLSADVDINKRPVKEVEVKRLSEMFGSKFVLTCTSVSPDVLDEIQSNAVIIDKDKKDVDININEVQLFTVLEGVVDEKGKPLFKNKDVLKKFKAPTPKELINKLLLGGEIATIYNIISDLSGYGEKAVEEIKN